MIRSWLGVMGNYYRRWINTAHFLIVLNFSISKWFCLSLIPSFAFYQFHLLNMMRFFFLVWQKQMFCCWFRRCILFRIPAPIFPKFIFVFDERWACKRCISYIYRPFYENEFYDCGYSVSMSIKNITKFPHKMKYCVR